MLYVLIFALAWTFVPLFAKFIVKYINADLQKIIKLALLLLKLQMKSLKTWFLDFYYNNLHINCY